MPRAHSSSSTARGRRARSLPAARHARSRAAPARRDRARAAVAAPGGAHWYAVPRVGFPITTPSTPPTAGRRLARLSARRARRPVGQGRAGRLLPGNRDVLRARSRRERPDRAGSSRSAASFPQWTAGARPGQRAWAAGGDRPRQPRSRHSGRLRPRRPGAPDPGRSRAHRHESPVGHTIDPGFLRQLPDWLRGAMAKSGSAAAAE